MATKGNPNIKDEGKEHRFSKTNQPKNNGRKPSKLRKFIKENNVSYADVSLLFSNFLFKFSADELHAILSDEGIKKLPSIAYNLIRAYLDDMTNNRLYATELMLRYSVQLPKQVTETTINQGEGFADLSPDEVKARMTDMIYDLAQDEYFRGEMKKAIEAAEEKGRQDGSRI